MQHQNQIQVKSISNSIQTQHIITTFKHRNTKWSQRPYLRRRRLRSSTVCDRITFNSKNPRPVTITHLSCTFPGTQVFSFQ